MPSFLESGTNSALRAHVARAEGIELAHSEGQYVIHFLCATCAKGLPARDFGFWAR